MVGEDMFLYWTDGDDDDELLMLQSQFWIMALFYVCQLMNSGASIACTRMLAIITNRTLWYLLLVNG